jgi:biotin carboxyl carrier protein
MGRVFIAKLDDREVGVEAEVIGPSLYRVRIDGVEQLVDAREVFGGLSLLIDGKNHEVSLSRSAEQFDVLLANRRFRFRLLTEERARRAVARAGQEMRGRREVKASMPGKVIEVLVSVGDQVEAKQGLLIIEAMKMENEIKTSIDGVVTKIQTAIGDLVDAEKTLVEVEKR